MQGVLALVRRYRPLHVSIVGGEPLVRYRELDELIPKLGAMNVEVQLVTSAVRTIPESWARIPCLHLVVSIDGLAPEHDRRRTPATYDRILENIRGHSIIVHCTITRQQRSAAPITSTSLLNSGPIARKRGKSGSACIPLRKAIARRNVSLPRTGPEPSANWRRCVTDFPRWTSRSPSSMATSNLLGRLKSASSRRVPSV